jgi:methylenetetrahydrofolate reductase (NADPH)
MADIHVHEPAWAESRFERFLAAGRDVITAELAVPATVDHQRILSRAKELARSEVIAVNITDGLRGRPALSPIAAAAILTHAGLRVEPIVQLTARTRSRNAVIGDLLGASALGIRNLLCMTGDVPVGSEDLRAVDVFELIAVARHFPRDIGTDLMGEAESFFVGATWSPFAEDRAVELERLERKCAAGAQFIQTQPVFDGEEFAALVERLPQAAADVPIIVGLAPIRSAQHARRLGAIPGIHIPARLFALLDSAESDEEAASRFWSHLADELRIVSRLHPVRGYHLMPIGHSRRGIGAASTFDRLYEAVAPLVGDRTTQTRAAEG